MCGLLGEVSTQTMVADRFRALLDLSQSRGPDQQGQWSDPVCQLGFNRLSILDLSENGKQPMLSPSGNYVLVFNGEIYNYKALQKKYRIDDTDLRSTSDSEILCHLIDQVPIATFAKELNGMFAIAIWNIKERQLYLMRDFSGIKPLFYGLHDHGIVFASQFNQVFKHPSFKSKALRPDIMKEFFGLGYMHAPNTIFESIFQIEPGQLIVWDFWSKMIIQKQSYFKWHTTSNHLDGAEETRKLFSECFEKVVKNQLQSDVPIATFLSSGYDSSLVTAYAKKQKSDIYAFTFGVDDSEFDETHDAKIYADTLQVSHIVEHCHTHDLLDVVDAHFKEMPEPFGDYSSVPTYLITQKAKHYATVMLSGDGGDELFWGYPRFRKSVQQAHWFRYPLWLRKLIVPFFRKLNKKLSRGLDIYPKFSDWILEKQLHFTDLNSLMPKASFSLELNEVYSFIGPINKPNVLLYLKKNEFDAHLQRTLKKVDLTSMANSLEVRVPFLDREMVHFSNSIISQFGITHDRPKLILKDDLYQFIAIEKVQKQKKGFSIPIENWLRNELKDDFIKTVIQTPFYGAAYLNMDYLQSLVSDFYKNQNKVNPWGLWHLYAWQKWAINQQLVKA